MRLIIGALAAFALLAPTAEAKHKDRFPATIALPQDWRPEGIASCGARAGAPAWLITSSRDTLR